MVTATQARLRNPVDCEHCRVRDQALFCGVRPEQLREIARYREQQMRLRAHRQLFQEKSRPLHAYTLFQGWVALYKALDNGKRQILKIALPGDFLGFQLGNDGLHTHGAETLTQATLCAFPFDKVLEMVSKQPAIATRLCEMSVRDISMCHEHLICATKKDAREKIAHICLETYYRVRRQSPEDYDPKRNAIFFPLTQEYLGDMVGLTNVHVNRMLKKLAADRVLTCHNRRLTIHNEERLIHIAQFDFNTLAPISPGRNIDARF